jgi:hypothetical protein
MKNTQSPYTFERGYPAVGTADRVDDASDLRRAIEAYKFFYPTVATEALSQQFLAAGAKFNDRSLILLATPKQVIPTGNSDTPYSLGVFDLSTTGPLVVEMPAGPFIGMFDDWHMRWVQDMGRPGPDKGEGGKHLILPPGFKGEVPQGYFVGRAETNKVFLLIRSIAVGGDVEKAIQAIGGIKVYPLSAAGKPPVHQFIDMRPQADRQMDYPLLAWEDNLEYWQQLKNVIDAETVIEEFRPMYGMLASLGIVKGQPFTPNARMNKILTEAGRTALEELRAVNYASRIPGRVYWPDRKWEWLIVRPTTPEYGDFGAPSFLDLEARDYFSFQAWGTSAAMGKRAVGAGSMYLAAYADSTGAYLDGGKTYKLTVPQPVPAALFWSATIYDVDTRSQIATDQNKGALSSLFEKFQANTDGSIDLYFGPQASAGKEGQWIKTIPGKGWFTYVRLYGPQAPAFDGTWKLPDIEKVK